MTNIFWKLKSILNYSENIYNLFKGIYICEFISQKCRQLKIVKTHIIRAIVHTVKPTHKLKQKISGWHDVLYKKYYYVG